MSSSADPNSVARDRGPQTAAQMPNRWLEKVSLRHPVQLLPLAIELLLVRFELLLLLTQDHGPII